MSLSALQKLHLCQQDVTCWNISLWTCLVQSRECPTIPKSNGFIISVLWTRVQLWMQTLSGVMSTLSIRWWRSGQGKEGKTVRMALVSRNMGGKLLLILSVFVKYWNKRAANRKIEQWKLDEKREKIDTQERKREKRRKEKEVVWDYEWGRRAKGLLCMFVCIHVCVWGAHYWQHVLPQEAPGKKKEP